MAWDPFYAFRSREARNQIDANRLAADEARYDYKTEQDRIKAEQKAAVAAATGTRAGDAWVPVATGAVESGLGIAGAFATGGLGGSIGDILGGAGGLSGILGGLMPGVPEASPSGLLDWAKENPVPTVAAAGVALYFGSKLLK